MTVSSSHILEWTVLSISRAGPCSSHTIKTQAGDPWSDRHISLLKKKKKTYNGLPVVCCRLKEGTYFPFH